MTYDDRSAGPTHRISEAREQFATIINQVAFGGERVRLTRHGKAVAAVVPIEDVDFLEELEDEIDVELAREALADPANQTPIPWEEVKRQLGL
ncbi:MAG TPA: type II toxin-antitoxin system Phd/YefM family antitoxin [Pleomorphomonadaceae bacterium]|nr:type II toxin-antitoxin system Phd/YefM family antitoxin [Pleomorphomonadaceae bacterium]